MRIAVIAPGAMGAGVAQRLRARGADVAVTLAGRSAASAVRAEGLSEMPSEAGLVAWADIVLSILPPGEALGLARRLAPLLAGKVFVDCNAISPETVRAVGAAVPQAGFCDAGIIGGPPKADDAGPRFYASGETAADLIWLRDHGIDWRPIDGGIGAASALKMSYAGISKGMTAIGAAMALGAAQAGAADALRAELAFSQPEILAILQGTMPPMFDKAYRWVAEMEEIAAFLGDGETAGLYRAAAALYRQIAADRAMPAEAGPVAILREFYRKV